MANNLPDKGDITNGDTTEAEFQGAMDDLFDVVAQNPMVGAEEEVQLDSSGIASPTKGLVKLDTEGGTAGTDDCNLIDPSDVKESVIFVRSTSAARVITMKHNQSGTGKLWLNNGADVVLSDPRQMMAFLWNETTSRWEEMWRNFGIVVLGSATEAALRTILGLGTASTKDTGTSSGQVPLNSNLGSAAYVNTGTSSGQVPLASQLGACAFLSSISAANLAPTGVTPGTYGGLTINAQGQVTAAVAVTTAYNNYQVFTANGTWNKPAGAPADAMVLIEAWGGGGSGNTHISSTANNGGASSFGTFLTAYGGGKGGAGSGDSKRGAGGGFFANADGNTNDTGGEGIYPQSGFYCGGPGERNSVWGGGGGAGNGGGSGTQGLSTYGGNGGAWGQAGFIPGGGGSGHGYGWGGGGGAYRHRLMRLSQLPSSVAVTVGAGGAGYAVDTNGARGEVRITVFS